MSRVFEKGATSKSIYVIIRDPSTMQGLTGLAFGTAGLKVYYTRDGAAPVAITLVTQTPTGGYSSGGFVEVDATNQPGMYRLDLPNAVIATGVDSVRVSWTGGGTLDDAMDIDLTSFDPTTIDKTGFKLASDGLNLITGYTP